MSDSRPPLPLILAGGAALVVLGAIGLAALREERGESATALSAQPAPKLEASTSAPKVVGGPVAMETSAGASHREVLQVARDLLSRQDEAAALDLIDAALEDAGPDPTLLRFREALLSACEGVLEAEQAAIRADVAAGRGAEAQVRLATLLRRLPGTYQSALGALRSEVMAARGGDLAADRLELEARQRTLAANPSPEGCYELALWARERGFASESQRLLEQTVALDGFHEGARLALGHRQHEGRWYSDDEYKREVLGLVLGPDGRWVQRPEAPAPSADPGTQPTPAVAKGPLVPPPPPSPYQEDKEWYQDPESKVCAWEEAEVYKSKYYLIKTNVKPEYAKRYGKMMDQYFKRFVSVFKDFLPETGYERSEIYIHATKAEFHEQNPQVPKTAGGFYSPQTKRVVAYHGLFGGQGTTRDVLAHEGTHQFEDIVLRGKFWNCPIWIIEGLAVYFESAYFNGREVKIGLVPRERLWSLKRGLASNSLIPLRTLIRTPQRQFGGYHYAHAWSLIYMVIYGNKSKKLRQKNRQWFSDLFMSALQGKVSPEQVEEKLGGKEAFDELEAAWKEWISELPYDYKPPR